MKPTPTRRGICRIFFINVQDEVQRFLNVFLRVIYTVFLSLLYDYHRLVRLKSTATRADERYLMQPQNKSNNYIW